MRTIISDHARDRLRQVYGRDAGIMEARAKVGLRSTLRCGAKVSRDLRIYVWLPSDVRAVWALSQDAWICTTALRPRHAKEGGRAA